MKKGGVERYLSKWQVLTYLGGNTIVAGPDRCPERKTVRERVSRFDAGRRVRLCLDMFATCACKGEGRIWIVQREWKSRATGWEYRTTGVIFASLLEKGAALVKVEKKESEKSYGEGKRDSRKEVKTGRRFIKGRGECSTRGGVTRTQRNWIFQYGDSRGHNPERKNLRP